MKGYFKFAFNVLLNMIGGLEADSSALLLHSQKYQLVGMLDNCLMLRENTWRPGDEEKRDIPLPANDLGEEIKVGKALRFVYTELLM